MGEEEKESVRNNKVAWMSLVVAPLILGLIVFGFQFYNDFNIQKSSVNDQIKQLWTVSDSNTVSVTQATIINTRQDDSITRIRQQIDRGDGIDAGILKTLDNTSSAITDLNVRTNVLQNRFNDNIIQIWDKVNLLLQRMSKLESEVNRNEKDIDEMRPLRARPTIDIGKGLALADNKAQ